MDITNCPAHRPFNVFGLDDKGCCYMEHKYCEYVENCDFKTMLKRLNKAEKILKTVERLVNMYIQEAKDEGDCYRLRCQLEYMVDHVIKPNKTSK